MSGALDALREYAAAGGFVMPPLMAATVLLWYALGLRMFALRRGVLTRRADGRARAIRANGRRDLEPRIEAAFTPMRRDLSKGRMVIRSIVVVAPLAGLLGTVAGMIETFDALGDNALFAQSGGIAGGISQALLTTQMGLVVAVPGVVVGRLLDRKQHVIEGELDQIRARVAGAAPAMGVPA